MKLRTLLAGALLVTAASPAFAAGPYVGAAGGISIYHDATINLAGLGNVDVSYDTGYGFNAAAGYDFDGFRVEGEIGYKTAELDKVSAGGLSAAVTDLEQNMTSYMINGYYDIKSNSSVTPFIGVGLGMINGEFKGGGDTTDDNQFGYNAIAGVSVAANKNINFDLTYRLQGTFSDYEDAGDKIEYMSSNFYVGMRYKF